MDKGIKLIYPGSFEPSKHWYEKAINATVHPMIYFFSNLSPERIVNRYCHLHPTVRGETLHEILSYTPKFFRWAGADLINVATAGGKKQMVVIENNSCPSGQKSMPLLDESLEQGGYRKLMEGSFLPFARAKRGAVKEGVLACVYDKNYMEASGYAAAMADAANEPVYFVSWYWDDPDPSVRIKDMVMEIRDGNGEWRPVRACFRYLTQKPWTRLPLHCKTRIFNPIVACLAGGRNKLVASKAYDLFNAKLGDSDLSIRTPETIWDVTKAEIPLWVAKMGGQAVIKVPYSNAGQGVYTIVSDSELDAFMEMEFNYDKFIVQSLIGNYNWSSSTEKGKFYHVGTIPTMKGETFVFDLRMMIHATSVGFKPLCVYSRKALDPLVDHIDEGSNSWGMLGTNLSFKHQDGSWGSDTSRLMLTDRRDFNKLGLGMDDLIEAYIQTVLSTVAIDKMATTLFNSKGRFRMKLFKSLNNDQTLLDEIKIE